MLSAKRDNVAAKHFLQLALWRSAVRPRVINVDGHPAYAHTVSALKKSGELGPRCRCRPVPYLNNIVEQDHRFIKKRIAASLWFRFVEGAVSAVAGQGGNTKAGQQPKFYRLSCICDRSDWVALSRSVPSVAERCHLRRPNPNSFAEFVANTSKPPFSGV